VPYALRLNSRAGTEGLMVSSLICDRRPLANAGFRDAQIVLPDVNKC